MNLSKTVATIVTILVVFCLFESLLCQHASLFHGFSIEMTASRRLFLVFLVIWCSILILMSFCAGDIALIALLLFAIAFYVSAGAYPYSSTITLIAGITIGKAVRLTFIGSQKEPQQDAQMNPSGWPIRRPLMLFFSVILILLSGSAWCHVELADSFYHGPRWHGVWDDPNIYGMLMCAGLTLAIGLLTVSLKYEDQKVKSTRKNKAEDSWNLFIRIELWIAVGMLAVGLVCSYSRGSWLGAAVGLLYLAWVHAKFKKCLVVLGIFVAAAVCFFWNATLDDAPWYVKRADLGRPSAQHRVAAWKAGLHMMWDHPLGVGWNQTVRVYEINYSPPEGGAMAITTNDYLMLGTQLGWPGLICFVTYVGLCFSTKRRHLTPALSPFDPKKSALSGQPSSGLLPFSPAPAGETSALCYACRAGALSMLVAFWFDGGLFTLATAAAFWVLLELGAKRGRKMDDGR
jgi:hypothetical protein